MSSNQYFRYPVGYENKIYLISHETLWVWSEDAGLNRWVMLQHEPSHLSIAPNGQHIAFTGNEDSYGDVYIMDINSHKPIRKTFYGKSTYVIGWFDADNVIYATNYEMPFQAQSQLFKINIHTNDIQKIPCGNARWIDWNHELPNNHTESQMVIQRHGHGYHNWREYKGGTVGNLWIQTHDSANSTQPIFKKLPFENSNALKPIWVNNKVYFLSDINGTGNIFEYNLNDQTWEQKTHHNDFFVKDISKYGNQILYSKGGVIYSFDTTTNEDKKLNIIGPSYSFEQNEFISQNNHNFITGFGVNNSGSEVGVSIRGKVYSKKLWNKGYKLQHDEIRARISLWNDNDDLIIVQDAGDNTIITIHKSDKLDVSKSAKNDSAKSEDFTNKSHKRSFTIDGVGRINKCISQKNLLVATNNRHEMWIINLESEIATKVIESGNKFTGFDCSPDGKWIVYSRQVNYVISSLFLYNIENKSTTNLTPHYFEDTSPNFDPSGSYIYFLSFRDLKTEFDPLSFNLHFKHGTKPYAISLREDLPNPFVDFIDVDDNDEDEKSEQNTDLNDDSKNQSNSENDDKSNQNSKESHDDEIKIDLNNIQNRVFASSIAPSKYHKLTALDNKLLLIADKKLSSFNFQSSKLENIASDVLVYQISQNRKWIVTYNDDKLRVGQAGSKFDDNDNSYKKSGWISIEDIEVTVNPTTEWQQILEEVWWLSKEHFWEPNLNKIDWNAVKSKYTSLVPKIKSRKELNILLSDMIGELKTSHAYVLEPGDIMEPEHKNVCYLGCKTTKVENGFKILEIFHTPHAQSPLHLNAKVGDIITHINGKPLHNAQTFEIYLNNKKNNIITLNNSADIYIKPLSNWSNLSYQMWIQQNVQNIEKHTNKIGYVHIPNMVQSGFEEFYRRYMHEHHKDALIVDARYNNGGFLSSIILDRLQRRCTAYSVPRHGTSEPYPYESPAGPMVLLCNENTGSDGDIFTQMFKELKLGPVVGKRTWGGVVGIMPRYYLIDGGLTSQPEFGLYICNGKLKMENEGVEPDIEIEISPEQSNNLQDPQLEKAIEILLNKLNETSKA